MNLRRLAKNVQKLARIARVNTLAAPRAVPSVRNALRLPCNRVQPLENSPAAGLRVIPVDPETPFDRRLPSMPGENEIHWIFRREQRGTVPPTFVAELAQGRLWTFYGGSVFSREGRLVPALSKDVWGETLHSAFTRLRLPKPTRLEGKTLSLITPEAATNYHHWTMDLMPRAGLALRAGHALASFDHILVKDRGLPYQKEGLRKLGLDENRLIHVGDNDHYQADLLVVPAVRHDNTRDGLNDLLFTRHLYLPEEPSRAAATRRLYLSRHDASFRRLLNENELLPLLEKYHFEIVSMSGLSVQEQARLFSEASAVVGPNGSAFANLVYANPACRSVEFFAPGWVVSYNWMLSELAGVEYTALIGDGFRPPEGTLPSETKQDILLPPEKLRLALEQLFPAGP